MACQQIRYKKLKAHSAHFFQKCYKLGYLGWGEIEPIDIEKDYQDILKTIAGGRFQELEREVEKLRREIELLKGIKKVLVTEEALFEVWDSEHDDWWGES